MSKTMWLVDLTGPYRGMRREYLKHAGENAIASGFARLPDPEPEVTVSPEPELERPVAPPETMPGVDPLVATDDVQAEPAAALPDGFPGRDALMAAGFTSLHSVPRTTDELRALQGIGRATASKILNALED